MRNPLYRSKFRRCAIMDMHMAVHFSLLYCYLTSDSDVVQALAPKYFNTKFLFYVEELALKVLPCAICFIKGFQNAGMSNGCSACFVFY